MNQLREKLEFASITIRTRENILSIQHSLSLFRNITSLGLILIGSLLSACTFASEDSKLPPIPIPVPLTTSASILETNSLIARVEGTLDIPGQLYVEYWAPGIDRLRTPVFSSEGTDFSVHLVRLQAVTEYSYIALGTNRDAEVSVGPTGKFVTGELPKVLNDAIFDVIRGKSTNDLTFLEFRQAGFMGLAAFDAKGHIVWYFEGPEDEQPYIMAQKPNRNIVYIAGHKGGTTGKGLVEITPLGEEIDRLVDECSPFGPIHHDIDILQDERVMYLSRIIQHPGYGVPPKPQEGDTIGIWDQSRNRNDIFWNIFDHISPSDRTKPDSNRTLPGNPVWGGCDRDRKVQDWSHGESISMAEDGSVLASFRHLDQIISISPDFNSVQWRLGGPGSDFTFPDARDRFYHQHSVVALPNGNVLLFDNGNHRPETEGREYSRALELSLNMSTMTATKVWEYRHEPDIFSVCCSSVSRLDNGNTLILFGSVFGDLCCRPYVIVEVTSNGKVAWKVRHTSSNKTSQQRIYHSASIMGENRVK
mgnify:FL=1